jgi:anti-sigma factor RsiW
MHPDTATLVAYSDAELNAGRSRKIAKHLQICARCQASLDGIAQEKRDFSSLAGGTPLPGDLKRGLAAVLAAAAGWQQPPAPEIKNRVRIQLETYFGSGTASFVDRPDIHADELLARTFGLVRGFLGQEAAEAVAGDILRGLDCAALTAEAMS